MRTIPYKAHTGTVAPKGGGRPHRATYYPRQDGGHVARKGPHAGKTVAVRNYHKDSQVHSKHSYVKGYGHRTDVQHHSGRGHCGKK